MPIGVIVAVAVVCIIAALLTAADRANEFAVATDRQLLSHALRDEAQRTADAIASVATSESGIRNIRDHFDPQWAAQHVGAWLHQFFGVDLAFIVGGADQLTFVARNGVRVDPAWGEKALPELRTVLTSFEEYRLAGTSAPVRDAGTVAISRSGDRTFGIRSVLGVPALIAAVPVIPIGAAPPPTNTTPTIFGVRFIDKAVLARLAAQLNLSNLRLAGTGDINADDTTLTLSDRNNRPIALFAWTARKPGTATITSVVPFIAVAFAGFVLLAIMVLRYVQRTATEIELGETQVRYLAMHDPLTGLPNRIFFNERLEATIDEAHRGNISVAVIILDIDHFKNVNDALGHSIGDELILRVTARLQRAVRGNDLVARLGGDEFAIITTTDSGLGHLQGLGARIITTLTAPYALAGHTITIGASLGIAIVDEGITSASDVMRNADLALYRAKNEGHNRVCTYDPAMDANLLDRKLIENELHSAIANNELHLAYQPIVDSAGDTIIGIEALARWTHPERGEISPVDFIPLAESSGLIAELETWALRQACLDCKQWPGVTLAINVSPLQFRRADYVDAVIEILTATGFDPSQLELEVTESTFLGNIDATEAAMIRLKALGVRLALDDFGTGYSSLLYLRRFPFDRIKIDRSFVGNIERAPDAAAIVHAVVGLGRGLGMRITAEGVETEDQHLFLRAAGVHALQGYRFGQPCSADEISKRLRHPQRLKVGNGEPDLAVAS